MTNAERLNTFATFAGMTRDQICAARAAHMFCARHAPHPITAARYVGHARATIEARFRQNYNDAEIAVEYAELIGEQD